MIAAATADQFAWTRLALLTDTFGHRLSGSRALEDAIAWSVADDEGGRVRQVLDRSGEGPEVGPRRRDARPGRAARASHSDARPRHERRHAAGRHRGRPASSSAASPSSSAAGAEARGRIVLFNAPYRGYGQTVAYRTNGASQAAQHGAVAMLVRSVGPDGLRTPHTGMLDLPRGCAADSGGGDSGRRRAAARSAWQPAASALRVRLTMEAHLEPDADSANVDRASCADANARRSRRRGVPFRLVGRRHRRQRRCRRLHRGVGSGAPA